MNLDTRKVPSDDEIHRRFWNDAQGGLLAIDESVLAADWGVTPRTVRYTILRLIETGRMVKPFKGSGLVIVDPDKWAGFRAEIHARSHVIDFIHAKLWSLGRGSRRRHGLHKVRLKNNNELATWVGQQVIIQMIKEGRVRRVDEGTGTYLVISPPASFVAADRQMIDPTENVMEIDRGTSRIDHLEPPLAD